MQFTNFKHLNPAEKAALREALRQIYTDYAGQVENFGKYRQVFAQLLEATFKNNTHKTIYAGMENLNRMLGEAVHDCDYQLLCLDRITADCKDKLAALDKLLPQQKP